MKAYTGTVKKSEITKNRDGENDVRMLTIELSEPDDLPTIQLMSMTGDDTCPIEGDEVAIVEISKSYRVVIACNDPIAPEVEEGERKIYSRDSNGDIASFLYLKNDGQMIINGDGDFAVRFSEMESAFNTLKGDFNNLITAYNLHIHTTTATIGPSAVPGVISPTTSQGSSSTADISGAKIDTIEVPS